MGPNQTTKGTRMGRSTQISAKSLARKRCLLAFLKCHYYVEKVEHANSLQIASCVCLSLAQLYGVPASSRRLVIRFFFEFLLSSDPARKKGRKAPTHSFLCVARKGFFVGGMEFFIEDDETYSEPSKDPRIHALAGACAGVMEHCGMFPLDTIKVWWLSLCWLRASRFLRFCCRHINNSQDHGA